MLQFLVRFAVLAFLFGAAHASHDGTFHSPIYSISFDDYAEGVAALQASGTRILAQNPCAGEVEIPVTEMTKAAIEQDANVRSVQEIVRTHHHPEPVARCTVPAA